MIDRLFKRFLQKTCEIIQNFIKAENPAIAIREDRFSLSPPGNYLMQVNVLCYNTVTSTMY